MPRSGWVAALALLVASCTTTDQDRVRAYNLDGVQLFERGAFADARDSFQAALAVQPGDPDLLYNLAQCYDRLGQRDKAEPLYRQCLQRKPNHAPCRHALTVLLWETNRKEEAVQLVEDWLKSQPRLAAAYAEHAWIWRQVGDLPRAHARLQQAHKLDPNDNHTLLQLAQVYEAMNRPDRAVVLYERSLEIDPNQPDVRVQLTSLRTRGAGRPRPD
jgi:Tfp pilus assembly protein PilF